ncbi:MAG: hypothetical protein MK198_00370 [Gracilimonas sp.]|uniref:hypothetical protein n=1 Tax=Gracilimonas sp. TaxID=1974203 RepID=UPI0037513C29|nr:hypothetical protein [Gracilimonas sp.]
MKSQNNIDREVDKTMNALDGLAPSKTDPFFYSRLSAKLENRDQTEHEESFSFGFAFSMAAVILFLSLNVASFTFYDNMFVQDDVQQEEFIDEMAYEYQVFNLSYYENFEED